MVSIAMVEHRAMGSSTMASGLLIAREEAAVGVEQAGFLVRRVFVEQGARVRAGQPLAMLDPGTLRARLAQAQAQAANAQSEAARVHGLDGTGIVADEDIAARRTRARVAQEQLQEIRTQLGQLTVRAPVSGIVLQRTARPGSVSTGEPLFRIARDGLIELDAEVPEAALPGIRSGSEVKVTLADGETIAGTVRFIDPTIDPATKLGRVRVQLPRHDGLRVGGFASVLFEKTGALALVVPEKAVQFDASGPLVTVVDKDDRAHRVRVRTGDRAAGFVELRHGPPAGTRVALEGGAFVLDGDLVKPVAAESGDRNEEGAL